MRRPLLFLIYIIALLPFDMRAGARRFTYVYESTTAAPGTFEIESWVTFIPFAR